MTQHDRINGRRKSHPVLFLQEFLRNPRQVASVIPSSRHLERRIVRLADAGRARVIVELGAGSGGTTRAFLDAMPADARLVAMDINPRFCDVLRRIHDSRLIVQCAPAHELREVLARLRVPAPDVVASGIPFSTIDPQTGRRIVEGVRGALAPGGRFVAYQVRDHVDRVSRAILGPPTVELALLNVPPVRVYVWRKCDEAGVATA